MGFDHDGFLNEVKGKNTEELKLNLTRQIYQYPKEDLVRYELERREKEEQKSRFDDMLRATKQNADSTAKLVKATWALVIATALFVYICMQVLLISMGTFWVSLMQRCGYRSLFEKSLDFVLSTVLPEADCLKMVDGLAKIPSFSVSTLMGS